MSLVKLPAPLPSRVSWSEMAGFSEVLQQTPLAVTGDPPSSVMFPPLLAEFAVMELTAMVSRVGSMADGVVNSRPCP